jgi:membrane protease subunit HflC
VASIILNVSLSGLYRLEPDESAIIFRLGQIKEVVETPGTNFKVPILETAVVLSTKEFEWQSEIFEARTSNGGRISLRGRLVGRICSPAQFYITFAGSQKRVGDFFEKNFQVKVLDELKKHSLAEIISGMTNIAWQNAVNTELNELLSNSGFCMSDGSQRYEIMETWGD